ncbi:MAG: Smr/MutS family protein, partial [Clostridia bacterium]|nr:Smr/MutS family protein [Clostridia bacterium]
KNKQKIIDDAVDEAKKIISNAEKEVNKMLSEVIELRKKNKNNEAADKLEELKKELKSRNKKLNKKKIYVETSYPGEPPKSVIPGTSVYVVKTDTNGTVVSQDKKGNVVVQTGILKITVSLNDIRVIEKDDRKEAVDKYIRNTSSLSKTLTLAPELDLRGLYADEAIEKTKKFIDDAAMSSLKTVTIVHGKGTGALRAAIHDYLKTHPYVESFRLGNYGEGDHGVTVVELS